MYSYKTTLTVDGDVKETAEVEAWAPQTAISRVIKSFKEDVKSTNKKGQRLVVEIQRTK